MNSYEINSSTLCIVPIDNNRSCVYEFDNKYIVNMPCLKIIERSCLCFGSTFDGRREASCSLINSMHKVPIIIEETCDIIFFPTNSPRNNNCIWVSFNNFEGVDKIDSHSSMLYFKNYNQFKVDVSYFVITNQIIRCNRLKLEFNKRKKAV